MRLIFAGTPEFARASLVALKQAGHEIVLALTQPDRPAGRGMKLQASAVKQQALAWGIPVAQPLSLRLDGRHAEDAHAAQARMSELAADAMIVAAYGLLLPPWVLALPMHGCFNVHASLLPRWRGAAPIHRAIEAGDALTGITIMQMDAGLDTGDMLLRETVPIGAEETTASMHDTLASLGGRLLVQALDQLCAGSLTPVPQPLQGLTYAHKIEKREAMIDWGQSAEQITRRVRAFQPFPVASSILNGETLKIWRARPAVSSSFMSTRAGEIVNVRDDVIEVTAMNSVVSIEELQRPGAKRMAVAEFLRGCPLAPGMLFESVAP